MKLRGRAKECLALDGLLADAFAGRSGVIVLRGEAGIGKSALVAYAAQAAREWRVSTTAGVESEMELAYSGLHQLCAPMLDRLERLPEPQRDALSTVFGVSAGTPPDPFLVGLATLTLLAEVAEQQPLLCVVEDAQWLDEASGQIVEFVARRLHAERIALVCATRASGDDRRFAGLPKLLVRGLAESDARALLHKHTHGPLDVAVREQIIAECRGNPLALLELPRAWDASRVDGGYDAPDTGTVGRRIEQSCTRRLLGLPADTQLLVLLAAAEPLGDLVLLRRAADALDLSMTQADPAIAAGILELDHRVRFAHPLMRSAAYRAAAGADQRRVHEALARATDAVADPDRRAWHRARATAPPDEEIATELERSADRARNRGGASAAAAFLRQAVTFSDEPSRKTARALNAAQASVQAGALDVALELIALAEPVVGDEPARATIDLLRGQVSYASGSPATAAPLLLAGARRLEGVDPASAREAYLNAYGASTVAGRFGETRIQRDICVAIRSLPRSNAAPGPIELLVDGLAQLELDGTVAAAPTLRRAADALVETPLDPGSMANWFAAKAASVLWDHEAHAKLASEQVRLAREAGAITGLVYHLGSFALPLLWAGDLAGAEAVITEARELADAIGIGAGQVSFAVVPLIALRGKEAEASPVIGEVIAQAEAFGQGWLASVGHWANAMLYNGLGRYAEATEAARDAALHEGSSRWESHWALPELVEAASRHGDEDLARRGLERLTEMTEPSGTRMARGLEARCRALVSEGAAAEPLYRQAIEHLGASGLGAELGRAQLLYGEWLRREGRRTDARQQLDHAHDRFRTIGMEAFAERARIELVATGGTVRRRQDDAGEELTAQELQIARMARDGLSNPEIGARLFLSHRTVEWHLRHVFTKLDISSRRQLREALPDTGIALTST